jgi:hypothetical protein
MGPYSVSDGKFTYEYRVDGENQERQKDALKFLKDWATAFLTLETAMLTLIGGVLIGVRELSLTLSLVESAILLAAVLALAISIYYGMWLLHQFPAAMQRVPVNDAAKAEDIYKIGVAAGSKRIEELAVSFRKGFQWGIGLLAAFITWRVVCSMIVIYVGSRLPGYLCNLPSHSTP